MIFTAFSSLSSEQLDTLNLFLRQVVENTQPISTFKAYDAVIDGRVSLLALLISSVAAFFSFIGWLAQHKSTNLLLQRNLRRPNLTPIIRKLYDDLILLNIVFEYDSDYQMSYSDEMRLEECNRPSSHKRLFYNMYNTVQLISEMKLSEDFIILDKYEIYHNEDIYNLAYKVRESILKFNELISRLCQEINNKSSDKAIFVDKDNLLNCGRSIIRNLIFLDERIREDEKIITKTKSKSFRIIGLEKELSYYILSRFLHSLKYVTPEYVMEDPFVVIPPSIVNFNNSITVNEFISYFTYISKNRDESDYFRHLLLSNTFLFRFRYWITNTKAFQPINKFICKSKLGKSIKAKPEEASLLSSLKSALSCMLLIKSNNARLRKITEECIGDIFNQLQLQAQAQEFDMELICYYDAKLQMATMKHNLLLKGTKRSYDLERRRISLKALWNKQRIAATS